MSPTRLLGSSTFRLALLYLGLFGVSVLVLLGFIYWSTAGFMSRQTDATVDAEIRGLAEQYEQFGTIGLVRAIARRAGQARATRGLYLLAGPNLIPLAGNLSRWPQKRPEPDGWLTFSLEYADKDGGEVNLGRARVFDLGGGLRLLVGRDIRERLEIARLIRSSLIWGVAITIALAVVVGILISRPMLRRIDAINATSQEIMAGDLDRRIPLRGTNDEFDRLAGNLNAMLDEIERLLAGMKQVGDNIAHDLRSPLARLRSRLEVTLMDQSDDTAYRRVIERTIGEADDLLKTFNALLSIAQAEAGAPRRSFATVDLAEIIRDVAELYEPVAERQNVEMSVRLVPGISLPGNRDLLFQAVTNLVDNAIKFSQTGGQVELQLSRTADRVRVTVEDQGPGIPKEARERVLERFYRLESSRTTPGSGLGLSLVAAVAQLHDGQVVLEDNEPGLRVVLELSTMGQSDQLGVRPARRQADRHRGLSAQPAGPVSGHAEISDDRERARRGAFCAYR